MDVGGTKIAAAIVDSDGHAGSKVKVSTEQHDTARSIAQVAEIAHRVAEESGVSWRDISAIGVAVPGIYYAATGQVWAPNLPGWDHIPLRDELAAKLPVPVVLDSDRYFAGLGVDAACPAVVVIFKMRDELDSCQVRVTLSPHSYSAYLGAMDIQPLNSG